MYYHIISSLYQSINNEQVYTEKKGNLVITLKAEAKKFDFSKLRADQNNQLATTGKQMYDDFRRMRFVINSKSLDEILIGALIDGVDQHNFDEVWNRHYKKQEIPGNKKNRPI